MLCMCVYMHSRFVENLPIRILKDRPLISEGVLSHRMTHNIDSTSLRWIERAALPNQPARFLVALTREGPEHPATPLGGLPFPR
jgi:hypothetical protein